jgi:D-alanyl-D-alanine carboxypeptidase (penicillin-binding protein 5/6)
MYRLILVILSVTLLFAGCSSKARKRNDTTDSVTTAVQTTANTTDEGQTTSYTETTVPDTTTTEAITEPEITTTVADTTTAGDEITDDFPPDIPESEISAAISGVTATNAFVYNSTDGILLGMKGDGKNIIPASITKLLTALYALEVAPQDHVITATSDILSLVGKNSSLAYIRNEHRLSVSQLIEGMMLPSGNDAAYVLAGGVGRYLSNDPILSGKEAVDLFMNGLNEYAKSIGCTGTYYSVPDGLSKTGHYTSTHDLIIIGKLASEHPLIAKYAKTVSEKVYYKSGQNITWTNSNSLINPNSEYYSPYVNGLKTGSLSGNNCVYVSATINDKTYLIGIFGCPEKNGRYDDAHKLINAILESTKEAGE